MIQSSAQNHIFYDDVHSAQNHIFYDDVHSAQNHCFYGCEQCAKMGGAQPYTTYMCMCAPHLAGVGSRAISSRTTTTHPRTQVGTIP